MDGISFQAVGVPWPITPADAIVITRAGCEVWPMFVAPEAANFQGTYEVSLRGGPIITWSFSDGRLTFAEGKATRPDCRISANPSSFLLSAYGRLGLWSPAFKGQMFADGRKPWLALRLIEWSEGVGDRLRRGYGPMLDRPRRSAAPSRTFAMNRHTEAIGPGGIGSSIVAGTERKVP